MGRRGIRLRDLLAELTRAAGARRLLHANSDEYRAALEREMELNEDIRNLLDEERRAGG